MEMWKLEKRPEWPVIAASVPCPICSALVGERCTLKDERGKGMFRSDFHADRKLQAAEAFQEFQEKTDATKSSTPA